MAGLPEPLSGSEPATVPVRGSPQPSRAGAGLRAVNDTVDGGATDCAAQKGFSVATTELAPGVVVDVYNLRAGAAGLLALRHRLARRLPG